MSKGITPFASRYCSTLDRLKEAIRRKRPELLRRGVVLQHDNATPHSANLTQQWLERFGWEILPHPAHSPDLAPSDFHLFGPLKRHLGGMAFETEDDLISELRNWFDNLDVDFFRALFHFLVLPRQKIPSLKSITPNDLPLLNHIQKKGEEIAKRANEELKFRFGYHAVPSMSHLHMHVISQDFNSPCLKTKKHWNSFTSAYFVDSEDVIKQIRQKGQFSPDVNRMNDLLKSELRCHVCKRLFPTIPSLKAHIVMHDVTVLKDS
ncbi:Aprataxin [Plakobranchus ocellatus]|uniref:Aprataxin n=1 Tax=Plakobranchus ocellatus TaxID=259542 RepID=A0AAV4DSY9_9GAST|nr:Aprataxin [Plakobranchus ocellatus]